MATIITSEGVITTNMHADRLSLGDGAAVAHITCDPLEDDDSYFPNSVALFRAMTKLQNQFNNVATTIKSIPPAVFSSNLISASFLTTAQDVNLGWNISGWISNWGTATISNPGVYQHNNALAIPTGRYPTPGQYFLILTVAQISGELIVYLNDEPIETITTVGTHAISFNITNTASDRVYVQASNLPVHGITKLTGGFLCSVVSTLYSYVNYLISTALDSVTADAITVAQVDAIVASAVAPFTTLIATKADILSVPTEVSQLNNDAGYTTGAVVANAVPDTVAAAPIGFPIGDLLAVRLAQLIQTQYLCHDTVAPYSPYSGLISSTVPGSTSLGQMVLSTALPTDRVVLFPANQLPTITYKFQTPRTVAGVILYTQKQAGVSLASHISVSVNGTITSGTIVTSGSPQNGTVESLTIPITNVKTSEITITIVSINDVSQAEVSLGFDVQFSDVSTDLEIPTGVLVSYINTTGLKNYKTSVPVAINTSNMLPEYTYVVSLAMEPNVTVELFPIPPVIYPGSSAVFSYPLKSMTSNSFSYLGTCSSTGLSDPNSAYEIYGENYLKAAPGATEVTITQLFPQGMAVDHISVLMPSMLDITNIGIAATSGGPTIAGSLVDGGLTVTQAAHGVYLTLPLHAETQVTGFSVIIQGSAIRLGRIDVAIVPTVIYDPDTHLWSDGVSRKIVGFATLHTSGRYTIDCVPIGTSGVIPINDLSPVWLLETYRINNPYLTSDITVVVSCAASVSIDENFIDIMALDDDVSCVVKITRN